MIHRFHLARRAVVAAVIFVVAATALPLNAADSAALARLDFRQVIRESKEQVFPAVVYIKCLRQSMEAGKKQTQEVTGSGVIISPKGELITNWHVIDKATEVRCLLFNGKHYDANVVGKDKDLDIAIVQLELPEDAEDLPYAELGTSKNLGEGDFVMAMGAPYGLSRSVSIGIISCTRRYLPDNSEYSLWLQTDASINPGNSGGPLVNTDGQVIGINTRGMVMAEGMGFAVPIDVVRSVLPRLREKGEANWSWTGLRLQPLRDFNRNIYFKGDQGVIVASTDPESPARRAGIVDNDRILKIDGKPVNGLTEEDLPEIRRVIGMLAVDEPVMLDVQRGDERMTVELTPRVKGEVEGEELDCPRWDLTFKAINQFDNPQLYFYRKEGVFIYGIKYPGNAANSGLNESDIVVKIGNKKVNTLEDIKAIHEEAIENVDDEHRITFTVLRSGLMRQVVLDFQRDFERK